MKKLRNLLIAAFLGLAILVSVLPAKVSASTLGDSGWYSTTGSTYTMYVRDGSKTIEYGKGQLSISSGTAYHYFYRSRSCYFTIMVGASTTEYKSKSYDNTVTSGMSTYKVSGKAYGRIKITSTFGE